MTDSYTKTGAERLARTIADYWHNRGHKNVKARTFKIDGQENMYGVASNLKAGLPPPRTKSVKSDVPAALGVFVL